MLLPDPKEDKDSEDNSEDTQEDEDTSEDETEDSDDTSEDSEETDSEIEEGKVFFNPKDVPKELQPTYRKMLASYTRKAQVFAEARKKANAFDRLTQDSRFQDWVGSLRKGAGRQSSNSNNGREEEDDEDAPVTKKDLKALLASDKQEREREKKEAAIKESAKRFKQAHPDWEMYQDRMFEIMDESPGISYEHAYIIASREDDETSKKDRMISKKKANLHKPSRSGVGEGEATKKKLPTFAEAVEMAKEQLRKGVKR